MALHLTNTLGQRREPFKSREPGEVRIFTCGPSTYRRPHIGNYRSFLYEDLLVRYLEYLGYTVHRVINFTDVEDKTIVEAAGQGESVSAITERVHDRFFEESAVLGLKLPAQIPRATATVDTAAEMIRTLEAKGYAYEHEGKYYFAASKVENFGRLYGLDTARWPERPVRFGRDTYEGRRWNLGDFVLWHGEETGDALPEGSVWETDLGRGRPSWNVQDPSMIVAHLGAEIDIQCGGVDNLYRHHDYNIAVMEAYSGREFARYFLHGEHLIVEGSVMSKSKGNVLYTEHILDRGYEPHHLRYFLLSEHYRKKLNFTWEAFQESCERIDTLRAAVAPLLVEPSGGKSAGRKSTETQGSLPFEESGATSQDSPRESGPNAGSDSPEGASEGPAAELRAAFEEAMNEDLSAGRALGAIEAVISTFTPTRLTRKEQAAVAHELTRAHEVLGVLQ